MSETRWTEQPAPIVMHDDGVTGSVVLTLAPDDDPDAIRTAVQAARAVHTYQHLGELAALDAETLRALLLDVADLRAVVERLEARLTLACREAGASWAELGAALGLQRQSAKERFQRLSQVQPAPGAAEESPEARLAWIRAYAQPETAEMTDLEALAFAVQVEADHRGHAEVPDPAPAAYVKGDPPVR